MIRKIAVCAAVFCATSLYSAAQTKADIRNGQVWVRVSCGQACLWEYGAAQRTSAHRFIPPTFSIDGKRVSAAVVHFAPVEVAIHLNNGATEYSFEGALAQDPHLRLRVQFQVNEETPVIRFRYILTGDQRRTLTAPGGVNNLTYLETSLRDLPDAEEITLSNFAQLTHSYTLSEQKIEDRYFQDSGTFTGPILAATDGHRSFLVAYEHGGQVPDAFLRYQLSPDRSVRLTAVKGNYVSGQMIDAHHSYQSLWMQTAAAEGGIDQLASHYRRFVLKYMTQNPATRKPYIFYNSWNFQERNKWWNGKPYLASMNEDRILKEIDVAHRMGVDVFVLDTGWYEKTGDWTVSSEAFSR